MNLSTRHPITLSGLIVAFFTFFSCNQNNLSENIQVQSAKTTMVIAQGKKPMILLTDRPYNLETPLKYFLQDFTPNDVFFVRWHLANLPTEINSDTFRLRIHGSVNKNLELSLHDLKTKFKPFTINALCACAGNARSCFSPRVAGAQWANGGMGNAKWTGVKLKDILEMAGASASSKFVSFGGLDAPPMPGIPDFVKSLDFKHAIDEEVMVAYEMNGESLPLLNGYPLKLVVPGWYATYWVGMLNDVEVLKDTFNGFWMKKAYLVPKGIANGDEKPETQAKKLEPISKMDVRSIFVSPEPGNIFEAGNTIDMQGLAFDGGDGISKVELSSDSGKTWLPAKLDPSLGKYSWRRWHFQFKPASEGSYNVYVKATNTKGETQPWHQWNRSGYMRNEIEKLVIVVKE